MSAMDQRQGPYASPLTKQQMAANSAWAMQHTISGEVTVSKPGLPIGVSAISGTVKAVFISVNECGRDDSNTLSIAANVYINGTSCLSTQPVIAANNGSASEQKTSAASGTGVTEAVIDTDNDDVSQGDVLTWDATITRTASPTTEIGTIGVVVQIQPD